jgi:hypothetical protein
MRALHRRLLRLADRFGTAQLSELPIFTDIVASARLGSDHDDADDSK